jgi:short-subunit dehydrogenase
MAVYYASKAYVLNFSLALSEELRGTGVTVTCLCPGPTKTGFQKESGMSRSRLFTTSVMDAKTVTRIGYRGMLRGKILVIPGIHNAIGAFCTRLVSRSFAARVAKRVQSPMS